MRCVKQYYGYTLRDCSTVVFMCKASDFKNIDTCLEVYVRGSFNDWLPEPSDKWKMEKFVTPEEVFYRIYTNDSEVMIPGGSGFPEFRYFMYRPSSTGGEFILLENKDENITDLFMNNYLMMKETKKDRERFSKLKETKLERRLEDFNLSCPACLSDLSNFRLVPATSCLYRGYHPYKRSKSSFNTEDKRIELVNKALTLYGIKSIITLSGEEEAEASLGEVKSEVVKEIEKKRNHLYIDASYNTVYYHSNSKEFCRILKRIATFMLKHPAPFYIHCRLGSDRTGVICAIFALLCGAKLKEVLHDYERTTNMGVREVRNKELLIYCLTTMFDIRVNNRMPLTYITRKHFIRHDILNPDQLYTLIEKLSDKKTNKVEVKEFNLQEEHTHPIF